MRKIRELLRLKYELGRSHREIAASLGIANSTVGVQRRKPDWEYVHHQRPTGSVHTPGVIPGIRRSAKVGANESIQSTQSAGELLPYRTVRWIIWYEVQWDWG